MEPRDAVKLAYQSEFAGGHLIRDRRESLARLKTELAGVRQRPGAPLAETIGGGLVRVHLAALAEHGITPEQLNGWFADTAQRRRGSLEGRCSGWTSCGRWRGREGCPSGGRRQNGI